MHIDRLAGHKRIQTPCPADLLAICSIHTKQNKSIACFIPRARILNFTAKGVFILGRPYGEGRLVDDRESAFMQEARLSVSRARQGGGLCAVREAAACTKFACRQWERCMGPQARARNRAGVGHCPLRLRRRRREIPKDPFVIIITPHSCSCETNTT